MDHFVPQSKGRRTDHWDNAAHNPAELLSGPRGDRHYAQLAPLAPNPLLAGEGYMEFGNTVSSAYVKRIVARGIASIWKYVYRAHYQLVNWGLRYGRYAIATTLLLLFATSFFLSPRLQSVLADQVLLPQLNEKLQPLVLGVGSALIGAAAIVASLVLFAMQVNVERMPHGLFRRLSSDPKLLSYFALAFVLDLC